MFTHIQRIFWFITLLFVLLASQSYSGPETALSPQEALRRANDPIDAAMQKLKEELKPVPGVTKLQEVRGRVSNLSDDRLGKLLAYAEKTKQQVMTKKRHLDGLLKAQRELIKAVELRWALHTVRLWQTVRKHEQRLEEIDDREYEAFRQKYPLEYLQPQKDRENRAKWEKSWEKRKFDEERRESLQQMRRDLEKIRGEMSQGLSSFEQYVTRTMSEVLEEFQTTIRVIAAVKEEQERRRTGREKQQEEEARLARLRLRTNASSFEVKTGETTEVWFWVEKGLPPYQILYNVPGGAQFGQIPIDRGGPFAIPFRFLKPGKYEAQVQAIDEDGDMRTVSFRFAVTGEEIKPEETEEAQKTKPEKGKKAAEATPKPKPPAAPQPPAAPKPPQALVGRFRAGLHDLPLVSPPKAWLNQQGRNAPIPFILEIDRSGHITAAVDYEVPQHLLNPNLAKQYKAPVVRTKFRLDGQVDRQSGKTELRLSDVVDSWGGVRDDNIVQKRVIKSEVTLTGWQIPGPEDQALLKTPFMTAQKFSHQFPWLPKIAKQPDGSFAFTDQGFFGVRSKGSSDLLAKYRVHRVFSILKGKTRNDDTTKFQKGTQKPTYVYNWFLQIFGPAPPPAAPVTTGKGELVGFGVFPEGPLRLRVGQKITFKAAGVFANNVFKAEDLTGQVEWQSSSPALHLVKKPSTFMVAAPGRYRVRGRMKGSSGKMRDITVIVAPKSRR